MPHYDLNAQDRADVVVALEHFAAYLAEYGARDYERAEGMDVARRTITLLKRLSQ